MIALLGIFWLFTVAGSVIVGTKYRDIQDAIQELRGKNEAQPTEVVTSSPKKYPKQQSRGTVVVTTKSPRQLEREAEEEADRKAGLL